MQRLGSELFIEMHGEHELADAQVIYPTLTKLWLENPRAIVLFDCSDSSGVMSPPVRRYVVQWSREQEPHEGHTIIIGASFLIRTLTYIVTRVTYLVSKREGRIHFVKTIDDGWALVAKLRAEYPPL